MRNRTQGIDEGTANYYYDVLDLCRIVNPVMTDANKLEYLFRGLKPSLLEKNYPLRPQTFQDFLADVKIHTEAAVMANRRDWTKALLPPLGTKEASTQVGFVRTGSRKTTSSAGDNELLKLVRELREYSEQVLPCNLVSHQEVDVVDGSTTDKVLKKLSGQINPAISDDQRIRVTLLLKDYLHCFVADETAMGKCVVSTHDIDTGLASAVHQPPYKLTWKVREMFQVQVDTMLSQGIIETSDSPWSSPVVLVKKKDGGGVFVSTTVG